MRWKMAVSVAFFLAGTGAWAQSPAAAPFAARGASASAPAVMPEPAPDPHAAIRQKLAGTGVALPPGDEFKHDWVYQTYAERVTLFATLPPMNGGVAFVGDSLTDYGRWADAYTDLTVRNFGIFGDTTAGLAARLEQVIKAKPDRILILIGTNDIEYGRPLPEIAANIDRIVVRLAAALPKSKLFLETLLPRQPQFADEVKAVNADIRKIAVKRKVVLVDLYPHFVVPGGRLDPAITIDGLHLTGPGYARWRGLIQEYVVSAAGQKAPARLPRRNRPTLKKDRPA
jgi:lysophospholipase L1-like esterase